jgi:hypothetical protein
MTRPADLEIVNDQVSQWNDTGRERMQNHYNGTGKARGRRRRQVVPACSDPGFAGAEFAEGDQS